MRKLGLCLVWGIICLLMARPVSAAGNLKYFGFYGVLDSQIDSVSKFANVAIVSCNTDSIADLVNYQKGRINYNYTKGLQTILNNRCIYTTRAGGVKEVLRPDWEERVEEYYVAMKPTIETGKVVALYPMDEPDGAFGDNYNSDYQKIVTKITYMMSDWKVKPPIYMTMTSSGPLRINSGEMTIPKEIGWLAFDEYGCWGSECFGGVGIEEKFNMLLRKVDPTKTKMVVISDGESKNQLPGDESPWIERAKKFYDLCDNPSNNCIAILPFLWNTTSDAFNKLYGINEMPGLKAEFVDQGKSVVNLDCPVLDNVECVSDTQVRLSWKIMGSASRYSVRINKEPYSDWFNLGAGDTAVETANNYLEFQTEPGKNYIWSVQGIRPNESYPYAGCVNPADIKSNSNTFSCQASTLSCAGNLSGSCQSGGTVRLSWAAIPGAVKYNIRINSEPISDWYNLGSGDTAVETTNNYWEFKGEAGKSYWWSVQGIRPNESYPYAGCVNPADIKNNSNLVTCQAVAPTVEPTLIPTEIPTPPPSCGKVLERCCISEPKCETGLECSGGNMCLKAPSPTVGGVKITGDANGDGVANLADQAIWKKEFVEQVGLSADFDNNGKVDMADLAIWKTENLK